MFDRTTRRAVIGLLLTAALLGCGDSTSPGGQFYFQFRANNALVTFSEQNLIEAFFGTQGSLQSGQFSAIRTGLPELVQVTVQKTSAISAGTYLGTEFVTGSQVAALIDYVSPAGVQYRSDADQTVSVTIHEITATTVRGTFRGTVRANGMAAIAITDGEFLVRRDD